jgi:hypothetical protein
MEKRSLLVAAAIAALSTVADAAPRQVLVMKAEGKVAEDVRARIDATIFVLARNLEGEVKQGDITFTEAATAVGCTGDTATCKDDVLGMLAIDEIVVISVSPAPSGEVRVTVARATRTAPPRETTAYTPAADPAPKLASALGALFNLGATATATTTSTSPTTTGGAPPPEDQLPTTDPHPTTTTTPPPATNATSSSTITAAPNGSIAGPTDRPSRRRLYIGGMIAGGGLVLVGALFYGAASATQEQIDEHPVATRNDLLELQDLEAKGDSQALVGNVAFFSGLVVGGVSGYLFWRDRRRSSRSASIAPLVVDGGGGIVVTIGGGKP